MLNEIEQILYDVALDVVSDYQDELKKFNKIATGELYDVKAEVNVNGGTYTISLILQDYWKYVEQGRQPCKFPNVGKLQEWIKIKAIIPRPMKDGKLPRPMKDGKLPRPMKDGKLPTEKQLTFMIGNSIKEKGIQPKPALANALQKNDAHLNKVKEAVSKSLDKEIKQMLKELNK